MSLSANLRSPWYVTYANRGYGKSGTLRVGRHKGRPVADDRYSLACMRYIERNPLRAGMVMNTADYAWSSYRDNAMGKAGGMLDTHDVYLSLGATPAERQLACRELFRQALNPELIHEVRAAVQNGTPPGDDRFREQIQRTLQCSVGHARRGRPVRTEKGY